MSSLPGTSAKTVGTLIADEHVGPEAWRALFGSALGYAMDGFDLLILGFMLRLIAAGLWTEPGRGRLAGDRDADRRGDRRRRFSACCPTGSAGCAC